MIVENQAKIGVVLVIALNSPKIRILPSGTAVSQNFGLNLDNLSIVIEERR